MRIAALEPILYLYLQGVGGETVLRGNTVPMQMQNRRIDLEFLSASR